MGSSVMVMDGFVDCAFIIGVSSSIATTGKMAKTADDIRLGNLPYFPPKEFSVILRRMKVCDYLIGCVQVLYGRDLGEL
jgi:hypothetical protein